VTTGEPTVSRARQLSGHVLVSLLYVVTRVAMDVAGLPFQFSLDWMWLADPADLRDRLAETLMFFHAFPPGMNLATGLLLDAGSFRPDVLAHFVFFVLGLVFVNVLLYLARAAGLAPPVAIAVAIVVPLLPASIYFEHLYLYEWPVATMLAAGAAFFHRAVQRPSIAAWLGCFTVFSAVALTRSTFHLVWFCAAIALALFFVPADRRRTVLAATAAPAMVVAAVYAKNLVLFGEFAASTFGPSSLTLVTVARLPDAERDRWIQEGRLSPFAAVSVYAPPREYSRFFSSSDHPGWPPSVTRLEHTRVAAPNFNHWWLLEVHRARRTDALAYLREHPLAYADHVREGIVALFSPSTIWHPRDGTAGSPHAPHRARLGTWEAWHNRLVHGFPVSPVGWYVLLPIPLVWALLRAYHLARAEDPSDRARGALLGLSVFQIVYVIAASTMLTALEWPRYRYQIEWMIWVVTACWLSSLASRLRLALDSWRTSG
jgi:hypothetical protein